MANAVDVGQWIGEIRVFGFGFAPQNWVMCNGQQMPIAQNQALFTLLGVTFGGDGTKFFNLPNLQGQVPLQAGQGPGLSPYDLGQSGGVANVKLETFQMPMHSHTANADTGLADTPSPGNNLYKEGQIPGVPLTAIASYNNSLSPVVGLSLRTIGTTGGGQPHNNMMRTMGLNFCMALQGAWPDRN